MMLRVSDGGVLLSLDLLPTRGAVVVMTVTVPEAFSQEPGKSVAD